jgi:hypothetical protein
MGHVSRCEARSYLDWRYISSIQPDQRVVGVAWEKGNLHEAGRANQHVPTCEWAEDACPILTSCAMLTR